MKLYLVISLYKKGTRVTGNVYHLTKDCVTDTSDNDVIEVTPSEVKDYANNLGIRRICLKCRKAAARKRPRATGT